MNITKQQLKQIIKEEIQAVVSEEIATEPEPLIRDVIDELTRMARRGAPVGGLVSQLGMALAMIEKGPLNEITPKTKFNPGGFKGILEMASQAEYAIDNLETKFADEAPEEIYTLQKFIESIKKAAMWQLAANVAPHALSGELRDPYASDAAKAKVAASVAKQVRRSHTPAYKRD